MAIAREAQPVGSLSEVKEAGLDREDLLGIYRNMLVTRGVEERGHILYRQGKIPFSSSTGRHTRCGCTRPGWKAFTCGSAGSPAAGCAGATGARTSAPR